MSNCFLRQRHDRESSYSEPSTSARPGLVDGRSLDTDGPRRVRFELRLDNPRVQNSTPLYPRANSSSAVDTRKVLNGGGRPPQRGFNGRINEQGR